MRRKQKTTITDIILLVHPFYALAAMGSHPEKGMGNRQVRENASFILGRWGEELKKAEGKPGTVVIIVTPWSLFRTRDQERGGDLLPAQRVSRFLAFAEERLGNRLVVLDHKIREREVKDALRARGFRVSRSLTGSSFGEYWNMCVALETRALERVLKKKPGTIQGKPGLSVSGQPRNKPDPALVHYTAGNMRKGLNKMKRGRKRK